MVKKQFWVCFIFLLGTPFFSKSQVFEEGNIIVDGYYGVPNIMTSVLKNVLKDQSEFKEVNVSSLGPLGGKVEYLFSKRIGLGVHINYASTGLSGRVQSDNGNIYSYSASVTRFRILPTFSVHMGNSDRIDPYFSFSLGYFNFRFKDESNDPTYEGIAEYADVVGNYLLNPIPVAGRVEFGLRYFITDLIGINGQIGIGGGAPIALGMSLKFKSK